MPAGPRGGTPKEYDREDLLLALGEARKCLVLLQRTLRPKSGLSRSATAVIAEIDEFAMVLTGAQDYFHMKAHGTPARNSGRPGGVD